MIHHKWIARSILVFSFLHVLAHSFNVEHLCRAYDSEDDVVLAISRYPDNFLAMSSVDDLQAPSSSNYVNPVRTSTKPYSILFTTTAGLSGVVLTIALILIWTSASRVVRIYAFELFWFTHHLFIIFFAALG